MDDFFYDSDADYDDGFDTGSFYGNDDYGHTEFGFDINSGGTDDDVDASGVIIHDNLVESSNGDEILGGGNFDEDAPSVIVQDNLDDFSDVEGFLGGGNFEEEDDELDEFSDGDVLVDEDQDGESSLYSDGSYSGHDIYDDFVDSAPMHVTPHNIDTRDVADVERWRDDRGVQLPRSLHFDGGMSSPGVTVARGSFNMVPSSLLTRLPLGAAHGSMIEPSMGQISNRVEDEGRRRQDRRDIVFQSAVFNADVPINGSPVRGIQANQEVRRRDLGSRRSPRLLVEEVAGRDRGGYGNGTAGTSYVDSRVRDSGRGQDQSGVRSDFRASAVQGGGLGGGGGGAKAMKTEGTDSKKGANVGVLEQKEKGGETSSKDVGIGDKELIETLTDGFLCAICMAPWTNDGQHVVGCLPCGHLFGMSCITTWLLRKNPGKCPQCSKVCCLEDVRRVYGLPTEEFQEKIKLLESKFADMQLKGILSGQSEEAAEFSREHSIQNSS